MVGRDGIEPPTPGFSVLCSTESCSVGAAPARITTYPGTAIGRCHTRRGSPAISGRSCRISGPNTRASRRGGYCHVDRMGHRALRRTGPAARRVSSTGAVTCSCSSIQRRRRGGTRLHSTLCRQSWASGQELCCSGGTGASGWDERRTRPLAQMPSPRLLAAGVMPFVMPASARIPAKTGLTPAN
jgi:hypothetical protein